MTSTHRTVAFGVSLGVVAPLPVPLPIKVALIGLGTHAGAWPDYDTKGSTPSRELGPVSAFISYVVRWWVCFPIQWLTRDGKNARKDKGVHRRFTHTIEACALAGFLVWCATDWGLFAPWSMWFGLVGFVGSFSHVVLGDIFTPHGVPLCLTLNLLRGRPWHRYRIPTGVTTDHPSEHLVFMWAVRVAVMVAAVVALALPVTPYLLAVAALLGTGWHWVAATGLMTKAFR